MKRFEKLIDEICKVAAALPRSSVQAVGAALESADPADADDAHLRVAHALAIASERTLVDHLIRMWQRDAAAVGAAGLALALLAADASDEVARSRERVELLWTGPRVASVPLRRTGQALMDVIEAAEETLTVSSFAVYKVPAIVDALRKACERGVRVSLVFESSKESEGRLSFDTLDAIARAIGPRGTVYVWPTEKRGRGKDGRAGTLHAKCAVADGRILFVSSANLTGHAMDINMELGLLLTGGEKPQRVQAQFEGMRDAGILAALEASAPESRPEPLEIPRWVRPERDAG